MNDHDCNHRPVKIKAHGPNGCTARTHVGAGLRRPGNTINRTRNVIARALKAVGRSGEVEQFRFTGNNQALASRLLTIHRSTLRKKLEDLGLRE